MCLSHSHRNLFFGFHTTAFSQPSSASFSNRLFRVYVRSYVRSALFKRLSTFYFDIVTQSIAIFMSAQFYLCFYFSFSSRWQTADHRLSSFLQMTSISPHAESWDPVALRAFSPSNLEAKKRSLWNFPRSYRHQMTKYRKWDLNVSCLTRLEAIRKHLWLYSGSLLLDCSVNYL